MLEVGGVAVVAVVIPSYKVTRHILPLLAAIGPEVHQIIVVDDACPEGSGQFVRENCTDERVTVIVHEENQGVGGAVLTGYAHAVSQDADVIVKLDGDGQMDPQLIEDFTEPVLMGRADYVKGNRFYNIEDVRTMPFVRIIGNATMSFASKLSTGYWGIFDPTNGYTAISGAAAAVLPAHKISKRYFFESDMLFRLGTLRARVVDVSMTAVYGDEISGLKVVRNLPLFLFGHFKNFFKRIFYSYFLRDFSAASLELVFGFLALLFGFLFGVLAWWESAAFGVAASTGTVMLSALPIIVGSQLLLSFLNFDMANSPTEPAFRRRLKGRARARPRQIDLSR